MEDKCIGLFKALADLTRQEILQMLQTQEMSVTEICQAFERIAQPTISHHLQVLKHCDLVDTRKEGKLIYYSINKRVLRDGLEEFVTRFKIKMMIG